ncbi:hypothetical protein OIU78_016241 [Salix suchowensis]|nr:hypothetical protein OIU78_016241 [Salix suchowensis]
MLARGSTHLQSPTSGHQKPVTPATASTSSELKKQPQVFRMQQGVSFLPGPRRSQGKPQKTLWRRRRPD